MDPDGSNFSWLIVQVSKLNSKHNSKLNSKDTSSKAPKAVATPRVQQIMMTKVKLSSNKNAGNFS